MRFFETKSTNVLPTSGSLHGSKVNDFQLRTLPGLEQFGYDSLGIDEGRSFAERKATKPASDDQGVTHRA
jgi:hypothetical protein